MNSTGHLTGESASAFSSDCLRVGMNRVCPDGICMRVSILGWLRIVADRKGVSSHNGRTKTAGNGVDVSVDEASAWRIAFLMSSASYSGIVAQDPVHL
jgi:hypothetical protein